MAKVSSPLSSTVAISRHRLGDDGVIPNNAALPLVVYSAVFDLPSPDLAETFERHFEANNWGGLWRWGVYDFHHYHSTAHEVLGVYRGSAAIQFGGENGIVADVMAGDMVVIPAGVAHRKLSSRSRFSVVGGYPQGQRHDTCYGSESERTSAIRRIASVPLPSTDPIFGKDGPLLEIWG